MSQPLLGIRSKSFQANTLLILLFSILGCSSKRVVLVPAPDAVLAGQPNSAEGTNQGISLLLQADAWDGYPRSLEGALIPLKVTIRNRSAHDVAIRYDDFCLIAANDQRYTDIPPEHIRGFGTERLTPSWAYSDAEQRVHVQLPTEAMVKVAMSEGVVAPGGETSGFLYFPRVFQTPQEIRFSTKLVDAHTNETFGGIVVPLSVKSIRGADTFSPPL